MACCSTYSDLFYTTNTTTTINNTNTIINNNNNNNNTNLIFEFDDYEVFSPKRHIMIYSNDIK